MNRPDTMIAVTPTRSLVPGLPSKIDIVHGKHACCIEIIVPRQGRASTHVAPMFDEISQVCEDLGAVDTSRRNIALSEETYSARSGPSAHDMFVFVEPQNRDIVVSLVEVGELQGG